ncbi:uncharacterized protein BDR25DRAFT_360947 [Lindgomyces ingoldianus]|uniref:Uncharacterized protein n=1 Tax=Lindgomyces ingoldianus TaxID=673940 RepID=A0ACB6QDS1_9PLEO|nr:uncharacterized protein BDR25DRAFT_360947 [Lindgomyces ingoldianus]KAF2465041.1 hypothetical protein BDR25DRAFT_360947 [Lindgomyces ingoldianus]
MASHTARHPARICCLLQDGVSSQGILLASGESTAGSLSVGEFTGLSLGAPFFVPRHWLVCFTTLLPPHFDQQSATSRQPGRMISLELTTHHVIRGQVLHSQQKNALSPVLIWRTVPVVLNWNNVAYPDIPRLETPFFKNDRFAPISYRRQQQDLYLSLFDRGGKGREEKFGLDRIKQPYVSRQGYPDPASLLQVHPSMSGSWDTKSGRPGSSSTEISNGSYSASIQPQRQRSPKRVAMSQPNPSHTIPVGTNRRPSKNKAQTPSLYPRSQMPPSLQAAIEPTIFSSNGAPRSIPAAGNSSASTCYGSSRLHPTNPVNGAASFSSGIQDPGSFTVSPTDMTYFSYVPSLQAQGNGNSASPASTPASPPMECGWMTSSSSYQSANVTAACTTQGMSGIYMPPVSMPPTGGFHYAISSNDSGYEALRICPIQCANIDTQSRAVTGENFTATQPDHWGGEAMSFHQGDNDSRSVATNGFGNNGAISETPSVASVSCSKCTQVFTGQWAQRNLTRHREGKHSSTVVLHCGVCLKEYHRKGKLYQGNVPIEHERDRHPELRRAPPIPRKKSHDSVDHDMNDIQGEGGKVESEDAPWYVAANVCTGSNSTFLCGINTLLLFVSYVNLFFLFVGVVKSKQGCRYAATNQENASIACEMDVVNFGLESLKGYDPFLATPTSLNDLFRSKPAEYYGRGWKQASSWNIVGQSTCPLSSGHDCNPVQSGRNPQTQGPMHAHAHEFAIQVGRIRWRSSLKGYRVLDIEVPVLSGHQVNYCMSHNWLMAKGGMRMIALSYLGPKDNIAFGKKIIQGRLNEARLLLETGGVNMRPGFWDQAFLEDDNFGNPKIQP